MDGPEVITFERLVSIREQFSAVLSGSNQRLREQADQLNVSDEVLRYIADHFAEALISRHPDYARRLIQMVVVKGELYKVKLRLHYTPEILMEALTPSVAQGITGLWTVSPWWSVPNPSYSLRVHELVLEHRKRGQGSFHYCRKV